MKPLDDFLIDRVFQPVSDHVARYTSPYAIAAFLMTGATLAHAAAVIAQANWVGLAIGTSYFAFRTYSAYRLDAAPPSDVLPLERISERSVRVLWLLLSAIIGFPATVTFWRILPHPYASLAIDIAMFTAVIAFYFMACRKNPPQTKRQTSALPASAFPHNAS